MHTRRTQMPPPVVTQPEPGVGWYQALSLAERLALGVPNGAGDATASWQTNPEAAERLQEWKSQQPFEQGTCFAHRLAQDDLTEEQLLALLAEPMTALRHRAQVAGLRLDWLEVLLAAFGQGSEQEEIAP